MICFAIQPKGIDMFPQPNELKWYPCYRPKPCGECCVIVKGTESRERKLMKLKNVLIVVKDIERARRFYHDLFGLELIHDNDGNMILTDGLVLQEEKYWTEFLGKEIISENNSSELYFEETDIEGFVRKLEDYYPEVKYVNRLMTHSWGQKVIRFYDPDGNLIEVGTPM